MISPDGNMLKGKPFPDPAFIPSREQSLYVPFHTFDLPKGAERHYGQQFADMYFLRLAQLKEAVRQRAEEEWGHFKLGNEQAVKVDRVLDVRQGELCWVIGTVYMEMALKPNILDDISKEHWISAPPARETYRDASGAMDMMLEDESGRLRIASTSLTKGSVTGCVLAALGTEQADGTFQIIETVFADLPRQPQRWEHGDAQLASSKKPKPKRSKAGKLAIISGLEITGTKDDDLALDMLMEYLTGETGGRPAQTEATKITRLIIAGNSLANSSPILSREDYASKKANKKQHYGYDASAYNSSPTECFDSFLSEILPSLPITLIPGPSDPANVALPQQPLHPALFPKSRQYAKPPVESNETLDGLDSVTNPWEGEIDGWRLLGTGGQTIDDLLKYVDDLEVVDAMELMLRWRCVAPTAPDTLWCYPFQDDDALLVKDCPHIYIAGNQPSFKQKIISGPANQEVLLLSIPKFSSSKLLVLVDMETLKVETVKFGVSPRSKT